MGASPRVAGMVVLYRPGPEVVDNISSYLGQVETLYAVDNTEEPQGPLVAAISSLPGVSYLSNKANLGVAAALNAGVRLAGSDHFEWLLTMDQDSVATVGMVATMLDCLSGLEPERRVGLLAPFHVQVGGAERSPQGRCVEILTPMTSGSLVNLEACTDVGPFLEELFIDQVDNEFALRLRAAGYSVLEVGEARLAHRVGDVRRHRLPIPMYTTNHPPVRRYYITRNRFYVGRMYRDRFPDYRRFELRQVAKDIIKIVIYERQKWAKLCMMTRGYIDFRAGRLGPYRPSRFR